MLFGGRRRRHGCWKPTGHWTSTAFKRMPGFSSHRSTSSCASSCPTWSTWRSRSTSLTASLRRSPTSAKPSVSDALFEKYDLLCCTEGSLCYQRFWKGSRSALTKKRFFLSLCFYPCVYQTYSDRCMLQSPDWWSWVLGTGAPSVSHQCLVNRDYRAVSDVKTQAHSPNTGINPAHWITNPDKDEAGGDWLHVFVLKRLQMSCSNI